MRVLVTGVGNQLGHDIMNELYRQRHFAIGTDVQEEYPGVDDRSAAALSTYTKLDISDIKEASMVLKKEKPDAVICCSFCSVKTDGITDMSVLKQIAEVCSEIECKLISVVPIRNNSSLPDIDELSGICDRCFTIYIPDGKKNCPEYTRILAGKLVTLAATEDYGVYTVVDDDNLIHN